MPPVTGARAEGCTGEGCTGEGCKGKATPQARATAWVERGWKGTVMTKDIYLAGGVRTAIGAVSGGVRGGSRACAGQCGHQGGAVRSGLGRIGSMR